MSKGPQLFCDATGSVERPISGHGFVLVNQHLFDDKLLRYNLTDDMVCVLNGN